MQNEQMGQASAIGGGVGGLAFANIGRSNASKIKPYFF